MRTVNVVMPTLTAINAYRRLTVLSLIITLSLAGAMCVPRVARAELGEPGELVYSETLTGTYIAGPNGANGRQLYSFKEFGLGAESQLSPNGQYVLICNGETVWLANAFAPANKRVELYEKFHEDFSSIRFAPDGKSFYYVYSGTTGHPAGIYNFNLATLISTRIVSWSIETNDLSVASNGEILFQTTENPSKEKLSQPQWWTVNGSGGEPQQVLTKYAKSSSIVAAAISPNGTQVVFQLEASVSTASISGLSVKTLVKHSGSNNYSQPSWSPNGSYIIYRGTTKTTNETLYRIPASGGTSELLVSPKAGSAIFAPFYRQASSLTPIEVLAYTLRPNLYFDKGEPWRPLNVEGFLSEKNSFGEGLNQVCNGEGTCYPLATPSDLNKSRTSKSFIDVKGNYKTEGKSSYHTPESGCLEGALLDCNSGTRSSIYYHVVGPHEGYTYIDYWLFYRFNLYSEALPESVAGNHEGDWESVTIAPSSTGETFDFASFSQHGTWYSYLRFAMACEAENKTNTCGSEKSPTGGHVSVFPAWGDHANYPETCSELCEETGNPVPENEHDGSEAWRSNENAEALLKLPTVGTESWVDWPGVWGNESQASPETPPMSPAEQSPHFTEPWRSECEESGSGKCTLSARANDLMRHATSRVALTGLAPLADATDTANQDKQTLGADHYCANWFGSGIQALLCSPHELSRALRNRDLKPARRLTFHSTRYSHAAAALGVAQAAGRILSPGQELAIDGPIEAGTVLFVRARYGRHRVESRFSSLPRRSGSRIEVQRIGGLPQIRLVAPNGRTVRPSLAIRSTLSTKRP